MTRRIFNVLGAASCAFLLALPALAANTEAAAAHKTSIHKTTADKPARTAWPAEALSGKIVMVDPAMHLAVVKDAGGIPFDLIVTRSTRVTSGHQTLKLSDLSSHMNKTVSVKFVPERKGDIARSIQLNG